MLQGLAAWKNHCEPMTYSFHRMRMVLDSHGKRSFRDLIFDFLPIAFRIGILGRNELPASLLCKPNKRQIRTADLCKQYLRLKYPDRLASVEDFILEIEGPEGDGSKWDPFIDLQSITDEVLKQLDLEFATWLKPKP